MTNRILPTQGIVNFRDYGGYTTTSGGQVRTGVLWRSAQHMLATEADLEAVHGLGLTTIIDLRGDSERADYPCLRHSDFSARVLHSQGDTAGGLTVAPHEEAADGIATVVEAHAAMTELYRGLPFRPALVAAFRHYFVAVGEGPTLLHCVAGKDRTGVAAALLHDLLGVHPDDMMADYMLTNTAARIEERFPASLVHMRERYGHTMDDEASKLLMSVDPAWLDAAFAAIRERHGSIETYRRDVLGVSEDRREAIVRALVA
jgi:protein-tyrosine phosphatase